jgi:general secretion pathway protein B
MSYILDALKKSDKQRQQQRVPDLNTVQLELAPPKKKKASWLFPLAAIVLANVLFILFFVILQKQPATEKQAIVHSSDQAPQETVQERRQALAPQSTPEPSSASREPVQSEPAAEDESTVVNMAEDDAASRQDSAAAPPMAYEETAAEPQPQEDAQAEDTQAGSAEVADTLAPQSTPEPSPASREPLQSEPAAAEDESAAANMAEDDAASRQDSAAAPPMAHEETAAEPQPQEDADAEDTQEESGSEEASTIAPLEEDAIASPVTAPHPEEYNEKPEQDQAQRTQPAETTDTSPVGPEAGLTKAALHIDQLPADVREQLPDIHISAHLYYKDKPASRFASINGKMLREGQTLTRDLKVAEITTDGVIFRYQEYLFYVPVFWGVLRN